jgi:hypothetical protein
MIFIKRVPFTEDLLFERLIIPLDIAIGRA